MTGTPTYPMLDSRFSILDSRYSILDLSRGSSTRAGVVRNTKPQERSRIHHPPAGAEAPAYTREGGWISKEQRS